MASLVCAITQGFNIYIVFLTSCDGLDIFPKILITVVCNLIGVYIVKYFEEKMQKDKLWKIEFTVATGSVHTIDAYLTDHEIPHSYIVISPKHVLFNCYCKSKEESRDIRDFIDYIGAKWFVSESKSLF